MIEICPIKQTVMHGERQTQLPNLSFRFLRILAERAPNSVSFEDIETDVWGAHVTRETMKQRVRLLRNRLAEIGAPEDAIASVHSVGYRLTIPCAEHIFTKQQKVSFVQIRSITLLVLAILLTGMVLSTRFWENKSARPLRIAVINEVLVSESTSIDTSAWMSMNRMLSNQLSQLHSVDALATLTSDAIGSTRARQTAKQLSVDWILSSALIEEGEDFLLSFQLINGETEAIIFAQEFPYNNDSNNNAVTHVVRSVQQNISRTDGELRRLGHGAYNTRVRDAYFTALQLSVTPKEDNLLAAIEHLDDVLLQAPSFTMAKSLRARLNAELVIRHGYDRNLAKRALQEARAAVALEPTIAELKYALARAEIAIGDNHAALGHLRETARFLPYVARDINAIEKRLNN